MANRADDTEDIDDLIDRAVDTFFVEAPSPDELPAEPSPASFEAPEPPAKPKAPPRPSSAAPSLDEAVDSLFTSSFEPRLGTSTIVTSGDAETDRAIDLAVDTLFIEEPDTAAPETTQVDVIPTVSDIGGDRAADYLATEVAAKERATLAKEPVPAPRAAKPGAAPKGAKPPYDDVMAREIERHMHTLFEEVAREPAPAPQAAQKEAMARKAALPSAPPALFPLRSLQEAILTLEWEISTRSVTDLANELRKVRAKFKDNVTVDFAALSMRVVLDYVVKRMSRAHPESIRFLLDVTDFLGKGLASGDEDPLVSFHQILTRYEKYKSAVRKAEGIPDRKPAILNELAIADPLAFSHMVVAQALTLKKAGQSLAEKLKSTRDPENLIRSFRFLVNRSVNRILESTRKVADSKAQVQKGKEQKAQGQRVVTQKKKG